MKALLISFLLAATRPIGFAADVDGPLLRAVVVCHNGKLDSGSSCTSNAPKPGIPPEKHGNMTCGSRGMVTEIKWAFIERRDGKDVYDFKRRFLLKSMSTGTQTTVSTQTQTKQVQFAGETVTIWESENQVIVIRSPKQ